MNNRKTIAWVAMLVIVQLFVLNACHYPQNQIQEIGCDVSELIDAINTANSNAAPDLIVLQQGCTYTLRFVDNQVDTGSNISANGLPTIETPITIKGDGTLPPVIERSSASGTPDFRLFFIRSTGELSLKNLHLTNGSAQDFGGGIYNFGGQLELEHVSIFDCSAQVGWGGGIANFDGEMDAWDLMLYENNAESGGGLYNNGIATIMGGSAIYENHSDKNGGGIFTGGTLTLEEVNIYSNSVEEFGGGIYSDGAELSITLTNLFGNSAGRDGGGLSGRNSNIIIDSSDVRENQSQGQGGGLMVGGGTFEMRHTKVRNNTAASAGAGMFLFTETIIERSFIQNNKANLLGGGINFGGGEHTITDTVIEGNRADRGGGIAIGECTVTVSAGSQILDNSAVRGGGVYNYYILSSWLGGFTLVDSVIANNQASSSGGGIANIGNLNILNSTITDNTATMYGGGLESDGDTTITNSTIKDNSAGARGGGIHFEGMPVSEPLTIVNSTISRNQAGTQGGGLFTTGGGDISFSTIANNHAAENGGIHKDFNQTVTVTNSIVANNSAGNCSTFWMSRITVKGDNLSNDDTCEGFTIVADPLLGPLAMNGGSTVTHALGDGSPAIDVVPSQDCTTVDGVNVDEDQRGFRRPGKGSTGCDLGAYEALRPESAPFVPPPPTAFTGKSRMNANCRAGPGTAYNETGFVPEGFTAQIEGRNEESNWLWIQTPNGEGHCWVSIIALELDFDPETLTVVASQALPAPAETQPPAETHPPEAQGCTVMQMSGTIKCVVPCPAGAVPGEACTP